MGNNKPNDTDTQLKQCNEQRNVLIAENEQLKLENQELEQELVPHRARAGNTGKMPANLSQLRQAFHRHAANSKLCNQAEASAYLLLFYATECGLKMTFLRRNSLRTTEDIADTSLISQDGHNLARWAKELRLPATITDGKSNFRLNDKSTFTIDKAHQVWRYGIRMEANDEQMVVLWLQGICKWVSKET